MRRVALIDDHEIVGIAVERAVAQSGLDYLGVVPTVDALFEQLPTTEMAVLDLRLTDGSSPATNVHRLVDRGISVLVLTSGENPALVAVAARMPVVGIVRKSVRMDILVDALRAAAEGEPFMSTELASAIDTDPALPSARLSAQEQKVLALFARGVKAQVVASRLGIAVPTVNDYVRRIRAKYAEIGRPAHTKVDLYIRAVEDGILPAPGPEQ